MMGRDDLTRLMADVLDGVAGSRGEALLAARLAADPEARQLFEEARLGKRVLQRVGPVPSPEGLCEEIRRSVALASRGSPGGGGWLATWRVALQRRPASGLVSAFVLGAVVGMVILASVTGHRFPTPGVTFPIGGTMQSPDQVSVARVLDRVDLGGAKLATWRRGDHVIVAVSVRRITAPSIDLAFDAAALRVSSVRWPIGAGGGVEAVSGSVRLTPEGIGECEIDLRATADHAGSIRVIVSDAEGTREAVMRTGP